MKRILYIVSALFCLIILFAAFTAYADDTRCGVGQAFCSGSCVAVSENSGTLCAHGTGTFNDCGECVCATTQEKCVTTDRCVSKRPCNPGEIFDACAGACGIPYVLQNPDAPQTGYISVTGAGDSAPTGSISYRDGQLQVKQGAVWQSVGANYTADRNIDASALTSNRIAVVSNPNFDKLTISDIGATFGTLEFLTSVPGDKLSLFGAGSVANSRLGQTDMYGFGVRGGAIYQKSFNKHQWYINTNVDNNYSYAMQLDRDDNSFGEAQYRDLDTHLTLRGAAGRLADIILGDGNNDRWALSSRDTTPDFEIWRNNGGWGTGPAFKIDYNTGAVNVPGSFSVTSIMSTTAASDVVVNNKANIGKAISVGSNNLQADISLIKAIARKNSLATNEYLLELITTNDANVATPRFTVSSDGNVQTTGSINAVGNIGTGSNISAYQISASGNITAGSNINAAQINAGNINASVNVAAVGSVGAGGDLTVGGVIKAGSSNPPKQITSVGGGLKMAELADEDFDSADEGLIVFSALPGYITTCDTVCRKHGLGCYIALGIGWSETFEDPDRTVKWRDCSANDTNRTRLCFCGG